MIFRHSLSNYNEAVKIIKKTKEEIEGRNTNEHIKKNQNQSTNETNHEHASSKQKP